jgi:hypothetical protein
MVRAMSKNDEMRSALEEDRAPATTRTTKASPLDEIANERDLMIARSSRGIVRDDEKRTEDWAASLRKSSDPRYSARHMWVKIGAVALRAIESIDRKAQK